MYRPHSICPCLVLWVTLALSVTGLASTQTAAQPALPSGTTSMAWIPGGVFTMGSHADLTRPDEQPVHRVRVNGFWMEATDEKS